MVYMRRITMRIILLSLILISCPAFGEEPNEDLHTKCIYPTVRLEAGENRSHASTTGIILVSQKDNKVYHNVGITVSHGVRDRTVKVKVFSYKDWSTILRVTSYDGIIYYSQLNKDIAVFMFTSITPMPTAKLVAPNTTLYAGQEITKVGCGLGDPPRIDKGIISGVNRKFSAQFDKKIQLSIYTLPGDSGSAIFNKDHEIVGILQSMRVDNNDDNILYYLIGFAADIKNLYEIIKSEEGGLDFLQGDDLPVLPWFEIKTNALNKDIRAIPMNPWLNN